MSALTKAPPLSPPMVSRRQRATAGVGTIVAVTEAVPLLLPTETLAVSGITVPVKLAFWPAAWAWR
jgi:hypothetical protein